MTVIDLHDFDRKAECIFEEERYSVRDNGAVLRHPREGKRPRPTDNKWTFGKPCAKTGYMFIASVRIHRIVATAFHGEQPTPDHNLVDHIDTNRRNNRPENLRWATGWENLTRNPITLQRIEHRFGSVEAFLDTPPEQRQSKSNSNHEWMRPVTIEEAKTSLDRMLGWTKSEKPSSGASLGEWIYHQGGQRRQPLQTPPEVNDLVMAKTAHAAQRRWRTPSEFPCCPHEVGETPIANYADRLKVDAVFSQNQFSKHVIIAFALDKECQSLWVMCENQEEGALKPWSMAQITFENGLYVHTNLGSFFAKEGAEKQFCLAQGLEWTGADSIDDYC